MITEFSSNPPNLRKHLPWNFCLVIDYRIFQKYSSGGLTWRKFPISDFSDNQEKLIPQESFW